MDHDDVVVVPVRSRGREDDDEAEEDEVRVCDHGAVTPEAPCQSLVMVSSRVGGESRDHEPEQGYNS